MSKGTIPDMVVVVDDHPSSAAGLAFAERYATTALALTAWSTSTEDLTTDVQASVASEPTVAEALRSAAQRGTGFVSLRRDFAEPETLLSNLLVSAANHAADDIPGFAVLLADGEPAPLQRILAIVDRRSGATSGLLTHVAVTLAEVSGAAIDTLVLDSEHAEISPDDRGRYWQVDREEGLFEAAMQRAADNGVRLTRIPVATEDPWLVITDQLSTHSYDLVLDDLGQVRLGGRWGTDRTVQRALGPGAVGDLPLRLLTETPVPLMLVIDEIRLGIAPASVLKAGTVAAVTLGILAPATTVLSGSEVVAAEGVDQEGREAADLAAELELALGVEATEADGESEAERTEDARGSSRGSTSATGRAAAQSKATPPSTADSASPATEKVKATQEKKGSQKANPTPPKGGAKPSDLAAARRDAGWKQSAATKDREQKEKAQQQLRDAKDDAATARGMAEEALTELTAAEEASTAAQATAAALRASTPLESSVLPVAPTPEQSAAAIDLEVSAQERMDAAISAGEEALANLSAAEEDLSKAQARLARTTEELAASRAELAAAKEKVEVYRKSLAASRQSPVAKGSFRLTARFGQHGPYWSGGVHTGLDFAGSSGTPIRAAASGTVISTGYEGAYGNRIVIDHGNGYRTTYNHLSGITASVGQKVTAGDRIGSLGNTGNSTGPHLHFEVTKGGKFIDPEAWLGW
jgi:murein DD-endopeptidase MepM/ murein hydrolase activator NlpD